MKQQKKWFFDDNDGKYIVVHLSMKVIPSFISRIMRRSIVGNEKNVDDDLYTLVTDSKVFVDPILRLGYVILIFSKEVETSALDVYSRRLRRGYQVINNLSLNQLNSLASPRVMRLHSIPSMSLPATYHDTSDGVIIWLMQEEC